MTICTLFHTAKKWANVKGDKMFIFWFLSNFSQPCDFCKFFVFKNNFYFTTNRSCQKFFFSLRVLPSSLTRRRRLVDSSVYGIVQSVASYIAHTRLFRVSFIFSARCYYCRNCWYIVIGIYIRFSC